MKTTLFTSILLCVVGLPAFGQDLAELSQPPNSDNERAEVSQWIGPVKVTIGYHSPRVHFHGEERTGHIWGELIQYGFFDDGYAPTRAQPWRAGANETTTITFSHDVKLQGKDLKAGTYALFLALDKSGPWTWILSNNTPSWGAYQYDPKDDVLRVSASPVDAPFTEFLTYGFDERLPGSALAFVQWENKRVPFKIEVSNVNDIYAVMLRKELQTWAGFNYQSWQQAAQICADNKMNLEEALTWADKAIKGPFRGSGGGSEDFSTLSTKAAVLDALGRNAEADAIMDKAVRSPAAGLLPIHLYATSLRLAGRKERAMEIYKLNLQLHPDEKFYTYAGMARGYTALGDKENAIKNWETALQNVPEDQKVNQPVYEKALKDLKEK